MKIAMVGLSTYGQGAEYVMSSISSGLAERGHGVDVIVSGYQLEYQAKNPNDRPFDIGAAKLIQLKAHRARHSVFELRKIITAGRYDVVLCHSKPFETAIVFATLFMRNRPKIVNVEHLNIGVNDDGSLILPARGLRGKFGRFITNKFDAQLAVSRGQLEDIVRMSNYPREKLHLVYNPVACVGRPLTSCPSHPWLLSRDKPVVVAAGAFCFFKNHQLLIKAFAKACKEIESRLIIFGNGELRDDYEKLVCDLGITECVSFPGFSNNLPADLHAANCFVMPSLQESFSVVTVEALAQGVPVIATDCPYGPKEILNYGEYGNVVANNDVDELANAIIDVLAGKGINPEGFMTNKYSVENVCKRYEDVLGKVVA